MFTVPSLKKLVTRGDANLPEAKLSNGEMAVSESQAIANFLQNCSVEVTPNGLSKIEDISQSFQAGQSVYVTFLPGSDYNDTLQAVKRLKQAGYSPVPHLAARSIQSEEMLESILQGLAGLGVSRALVIAGGVDRPLGPYPATADILRLGMLEKYGFQNVGLAGHPEGSPDIPMEAVLQALREKNQYAATSPIEFHLVTQFCFEAKPIIAWDKMIQKEAANQLPIHIGLPGLATLKTLLKHAQACGVGPSMRVLTRQASNIAKLLVVNAPDKLTRDLANYQQQDPKSGIKSCHLFPLGGLGKSMEWLIKAQTQQFTLNPKGGFEVKD